MESISTNKSVFKYICNRVYNVKNYCMTNLPDRTKIFISSLYFWVYITYIFNSMVCLFLRVVLSNTPDSCVIFSSLTQPVKKNVPKIITAKLNEELITNKLQLLLNLCWDNEIGDNGGINIKDLVNRYKSISSSVLFISYLFKIEKKMQENSDEEIGRQIRHVLIDVTDKIIYRYKGDKSDDIDETDEIIFGDIPF